MLPKERLLPICAGIGRLLPYALGRRDRHDLRELVAYCPGARLEHFATLDRLDLALTHLREIDERTTFSDQLMREAA